MGETTAKKEAAVVLLFALVVSFAIGLWPTAALEIIWLDKVDQLPVDRGVMNDRRLLFCDVKTEYCWINFDDDRDFELPCQNGTFLATNTAVHGFINTVHVAYNHHRGLILSPDDLFTVILESWAAENNLFAVAQQLITTPPLLSDFTKSTEDFIEQTRARINSSLAAIILDDPFTTTTEVHLLARQLILLNVTNKYFDYEIKHGCGFPFVKLLGSSADWQKLKSKVFALRRFSKSPLAESWFTSLEYVLDKFVQAMEGKQDKPFFREMIRRKSDCGVKVTGWINVFFPRLRNDTPNLYGHSAFSGNHICDFPVRIASVNVLQKQVCSGTKQRFRLKAAFTSGMENADGSLQPALAAFALKQK